MLSQYRRNKIAEVKTFESRLIERQKEIRKICDNINTPGETKDELNIEKICNATIIRLIEWIKMGLKGTPYDKKLQKDPNFLSWYCATKSYYPGEIVCKQFGINKEHITSFRGNDICAPVFSRMWYTQRQLYACIIDFFFPESQSGIFSMFDGLEDNLDIESMRGLMDKDLNTYWQRQKCCGKDLM